MNTVSSMYLPLFGPILIKGIAHNRCILGPAKTQLKQSNFQQFTGKSQSLGTLLSSTTKNDKREPAFLGMVSTEEKFDNTGCYATDVYVTLVWSGSRCCMSTLMNLSTVLQSTE